MNLAFGLVFPLALLGLFCAIQANIPVPIFALPSLTPGILVFGFSFFSLFSALLVARDRTSAFFLRLYTTPLRPRDFILGYTLPLVPLALGQGAVCLAGALAFGLEWSPRLLLTLVASLPVALLYISLGPGAAASSPGLGLRLGPCNPGFGNCRLLPFFAAHLNIKRLQQGE